MDLREWPGERRLWHCWINILTSTHKVLERDKYPKRFSGYQARLGIEHTLTCRSHLWSCLTPLWWEISSAWLLLPLELPVRQRLQWSLVSLPRWKQNSSDLDGSENVLLWSLFRCALQKNHHLGGFNLDDRNNGKQVINKTLHTSYVSAIHLEITKCEKLRSSDSAKDQADGRRERWPGLCPERFCSSSKPLERFGNPWKGLSAGSLMWVCTELWNRWKGLRSHWVSKCFHTWSIRNSYQSWFYEKHDLNMQKEITNC